MKKVLFIVSTLDRGGVENYLLRFLRYSKNDISPIVLCKIGIKGPLTQQYEHEGVQVVPLKMGYFNPIAWWKFYKFVRKNNIDTVCDFTGNFAGICLMVSFFARINKRIVFYRQSSDHFSKGGIKKIYNYLVKFLTNTFATHIFFNSRAGLNYFTNNKEKHDSRFEVISNGLNLKDYLFDKDIRKDLRKELGIPEEAFVVGHTGRYNVAKNHPTVLKVAEKLINEFDNIYFVLCGNETEKLMININKNHSKNFLFLGYREDVNKILTIFDVFIFPSITEGQPNSLIEAMAVGIPIVASNIEAIKETIPTDKVHLLIPPYDIEEYYKVIKKMYHSGDNSEYIFKDFACKRYNAELQFNKFLNKL